MKYLVGFMIAMLIPVLIVSCGAVEETPPEQPREGVVEYYTDIAFVYTDPDTKCQYLIFQNGGASPRMDELGKQICD